MNSAHELISVNDVLAKYCMSVENGVDGASRDISSNVTHTGDIDAMQHIR